MARESTLERWAVAHAKRAGVEMVKMGKHGWPDRIAFLGPRVHEFVEFKTPVGRLTPAQERRIPKLQARGEVVWVVDSRDLMVRLLADWQRMMGR